MKFIFLMVISSIIVDAHPSSAQQKNMERQVTNPYPPADRADGDLRLP